MFELILYSVLTGIVLSLLLIGPVYFLLIETSLRKGWRYAIVLNLGVIIADVLCIIVAYFSSKDLSGYINAHPSLFMIGGFFVFIYGLVMMFKKIKAEPQDIATNKGYLYMFFHGFAMNLLNIGVILFWFFIVSTIAIRYPQWPKFSLYMGIVLLTFFGIDLIKIFIANRVKKQLTVNRINQIRKVLGFILLICGVVIFLKGFGFFAEIGHDIHNNLPI